MGCLQDVHWSGAAFGYFPTYTLGNIYAAMLMERAKEDIPGLFEGFRKGDFKGLSSWLKGKIHQKGRRLGPRKLIEEVTGKKVSPKALLEYLGEKYQSLI